MGLDSRHGLSVDNLFDRDGRQIAVSGLDPRVVESRRALQADAHEIAVDAHDRIEMLFGTAQGHSSWFFSIAATRIRVSAHASGRRENARYAFSFPPLGSSDPFVAVSAVQQGT